MSDQTRGVLFVVLVVAITFVWFHFYQPPVAPQKPVQNAPTAPAQPVAPNVPQQAAAGSATAKERAKPANIPTVQASAEKFVDVESGLYRVELSNNGAVVRSWKLKKYFDDENPPRPLDLVNPDVSEQLGWPFSLMLWDKQLEKEANSALYEVTVGEAHTDVPGKSAAPPAGTLEAPVNLSFHWSDGHLDVTKKLSFTQDYHFSMEASVSLDGRPVPCAIAWRGGFGDKGVYKASQLVSVFFQQGGKLNLLQYKKLGVPENQSQPVEQPGAMEFAGIEDQFFAAALVPDSGNLSLWDWTDWHHFGENQQSSEPVAEMAAGSDAPGPVKVRAYVGPKDLALLAKVRPSLEGLVNFGWFSTISKALLFALQWLHRYISNWGWAIVILTLVINFAVFPLKMKSWRSMQEMQKVAPEMRSIQDRYKKYSMTDPRRKKMQEEIAELYQRHGINPLASLGGCLPMLVQMPIWWALWRVLTGAIELRHAPWIFWIRDLSVRDPYYILPVAMAITMYLMTKMTPQTAAVDPAQQKMMTLMPLMFAAFFFTYASGLNLYMFTSNLVGVGQQWYLNRTRPLPSRSKFKKKKES
ncbi:MAG TPA: membrane protein insertase YidC [Candidatus Acidoferrales bacterium]|nr:membrane protein insertase YidC [Candidatus Acidoferrales bacterium]